MKGLIGQISDKSSLLIQQSCNDASYDDQSINPKWIEALYSYHGDRIVHVHPSHDTLIHSSVIASYSDGTFASLCSCSPRYRSVEKGLIVIHRCELERNGVEMI